MAAIRFCSWIAFRFWRISSSRRVSRLPMPRSFSIKGKAPLDACWVARYCELSPANLLAAKQVADSVDCLELEIEVRLRSGVSSPYQRLLTVPSPRCSRVAARLVFATSSTNALSRKTTVLSPAGASSACQSEIPDASGSTSPRSILSSRQVISVPAPIDRTALPAMVRLSTGTPEVEPELQ